MLYVIHILKKTWILDIKLRTFTASGTSLTAPGSSLTSLVTSATMASFLNLVHTHSTTKQWPHS